MKIIALALAIFLSACVTRIEVYVEREEDVRISYLPGGVFVQAMPGAKGMRVKYDTIGVSMGCGAYVVGASRVDCIFIDPDVCGLAIWEGGSENDILIEANRRTFEFCQPREE